MLGSVQLGSRTERNGEPGGGEREAIIGANR